MKITGYDVAALIVQKRLDGGGEIDKLQLQKLLYLVNGAHQALWGVPAFADEFQAYKKGPVVPPIERTYREFPTNAITHPIGGHPERVTEELDATVDLVLTNFGDWTGPELEDFVKGDGTPWQRARGDLPASASSSIPIDPDTIQRWFRKNGVMPHPATDPGGDRELMARVAEGDPSALAELLQ